MKVCGICVTTCSLPTPPWVQQDGSSTLGECKQECRASSLPIGLSRGVVHLHFSYLISVLQKLWSKQEQLRGLGSTSSTKHPLTEQKFYHSRQARNTGIPTVLAQLGHGKVSTTGVSTKQPRYSKRRGHYPHSLQLQGKWQTIRREFLKLSPRGLTLFGTQGEEVKAWRHYEKH